MKLLVFRDHVSGDVMGCVIFRTSKQGLDAVKEGAELVKRTLLPDGKTALLAEAHLTDVPSVPDVPEEYVGRWLDEATWDELRAIQIARLDGSVSGMAS